MKVRSAAASRRRVLAKLFNSLTLNQLLTHTWPRFARPIREHNRLPLDLDIVNFR